MDPNTMYEEFAASMDPELRAAIESGFEILNVMFAPRYVKFLVQPRYADIDQSLDIVEQQLKPSGRIPFLKKEEGNYILFLGMIPQQKAAKRPWLNLVLFIATIGTTLLAGYGMGVAFLDLEPTGFSWRAMGLAALFSFSIMMIIGLHELGHYVSSRRNGVAATFPFFIPMPFFLIGTMGALIQIKSPIRDRNSLLQLGFSGPFISFILAIIALIIGIQLSEVQPITPDEGAMFLGSSIIFDRIVILVKGSIPEGNSVLLHPVAFAGWVGLFITAINLIPIGQFDGGHISRALLGEKYSRYVSYACVVVLIFMGSYYNYEGWWIWAFFGYIMGGRGVQPVNDVTNVDAKHIGLAIISVIVVILSFITTPFQLVQ